MIIPNTVTLDMMYRDGCNFKNCEPVVFSNKNKLCEDEITTEIQKLIDMGSIIPSYYGMSYSIAPIDNEFFPLTESSIDHSFVEICGVEFDTQDLIGNDDDISDVVDSINHPELVLSRRKKDLKDCIKQLQEHIESLKKMKL